MEVHSFMFSRKKSGLKGQPPDRETPASEGHGKMKVCCPAAVLFLILIVASGCASRTEAQFQTDTGDQRVSGASSGEETDEKEDGKAEESPAADKSDGVVVYICGEVVCPGVYSLEEGKRVCDAVKAAGGLTDEADERSLNQARLLSDGEAIIVRGKNEGAEEGLLSGGNSGLVNINTASQSELETLSGIGAVKAGAIIQYRKDRGSFQTTEELMQVSGIGESLFNKIKDQITVG